MATNTTNFGLKKPAYSDTADIADINGNMDKVDVSLNGLADAIAIVANNNTHAAITAGQFVYVHGHGSLAEGLYTAKSNIAANATLSTSNLQADGSGGLNALNSKTTTDNLGSNITSQSTLESAMVTLASNMADDDVRNFRFTIGSGGTGTLPQQGYIGRIQRLASDRYNVLIQSFGDTGLVYTANYRNSAWTWDQMALKSKFYAQFNATSESTLTTACSSLDSKELGFGTLTDSTITQGAEVPVIIYKRSTGIYFADIIYSGYQGYYYSNAWHWHKFTFT